MRQSTQRSLSLRTLLTIGLILPLLAMTGIGGSWALDQREVAHNSQTTAHQIEAIAVVQQLKFGLETSLMYLSLDQTFVPSAVQTAGPKAISGQISAMWTRTEAELADPTTLNELTGDGGSNTLSNALKVHQKMESSPPPVAPASAAVGDPTAELAAADRLDANRAELKTAVSNVSDLLDSALSNANDEAVSKTATIRVFSDLQDQMLEEAQAFLGLLFGDGETSTNIQLLFLSSARVDALVAESFNQLPPDLTKELKEGLAIDEMQELRTVVAAQNGYGTSDVTFEEALTGDVMAKVQNRYFSLPEISSKYAERISAETGQRAAEANLWLRNAAITAAIIATMTILLSALLSRFVVGRLSLVTDAAHRIRDGEITDERLPGGGPREIADVTAAFNDVSDLLVTLDGQVGALGSGRLNSPELDKELPGRIGRDIQRSVKLIAETTKEMRSSRAFARSIIDAAVESILTVDVEGVIRSANPAAEDLCKISPSPLKGKRLADVLDDLPKLDELLASDINAAAVLTRADGSTVSALVSVRTIELNDGSPGYAYFVRDISEREAWEARFRHQATHDDLTDLPNRFAFLDQLSSVGELGIDGPIVVLTVDLDHFASVNDVHGHANGDRVLQSVAARIEKCAGNRAGVARIDADEFALAIFPTLTTDPDTAHLVAEILARDVLEVIMEPIEIDDERVTLNATVGIAISFDPSDNRADLLRSSEVALASAKRPGAPAIQTYDSAMGIAVERRTHLELRLRAALTDGQLEMHAQPILDMASERTVGVELLARWRLDGEWIRPDIFVPIAEECGLIQSLGRWALGEACELLQSFHDAGRDQTVSVNVSGLHLIGGDIVGELKDALAGTTFNPAKMRIEITESFLLDDPDLAAAKLHEIRALGPRIIIDDFGTGYSSLTYLHALPIDGLKLDQSFVRRLGVDANDETIVRMVNDLALGLNLDLVAEGVETTEQHRHLVDLGYRNGQGWLWAKAMPISELWAVLQSETERDVALCVGKPAVQAGSSLG